MTRKPSWKHPALWILAPLLAAILYALLYPLFAPTPTLETVVPEEAILTQRFRDLAAVDRAFLRPAEDPVKASERLAAQRNLAGWVGVDRARPFHLVLLPRGNRPDPSLLIVPVANAEALRARFEDPTFFLEKKQVRRPQHLGIRGDWAAIAWDRDAVERLGGEGLTPSLRGATWSIATNIPALVDFALAAPAEAPWASILEALGFEPRPEAVDLGGLVVEAPRVLRIREAWNRAEFHAYFDEGRVEVDLHPAGGVLADLLARLAAGPPDDDDVPWPPADADAWLRVPNGLARAALAWTLYLGGLDLGEGPPAGDGGVGTPEGPGLLAWATPSPEHAGFWTIGVAGPEGALAGLTDLHLAIPDEPAALRTWEEVDPPIVLLRSDPASDRAMPPVGIARERHDGREVLYVGPDVERVAARFTGRVHAEKGELRPPEGHRTLARFGLRAARARALLGPALRRGGLFAALDGGDLEGAITTDGTGLRLVVRRR